MKQKHKKIRYITLLILYFLIPMFTCLWFRVDIGLIIMLMIVLFSLLGFFSDIKFDPPPKQKRSAHPLIRMQQYDDDLYED